MPFLYVTAAYSSILVEILFESLPKRDFSGEPVKTNSTAQPDSTEDIKMFDSPERDSEDFERSLKKTMECIAQV